MIFAVACVLFGLKDGWTSIEIFVWIMQTTDLSRLLWIAYDYDQYGRYCKS